MSVQGGHLHWRRARLTLAPGVNNIDTLLTQANLSYGPLEPPIGIATVAPPAPGTLPASRIQVLMLPPLPAWQDVIELGEPYLDPTTNTIKVDMTNGDAGNIVVNVLFWNPHTVFSPGQADVYGPNTVDPGAETTLDITSFPPEASVSVLNWGMVINGTFTFTPENTGVEDAINVVVTVTFMSQVAPPGDATALISVTAISGVGWTVNDLGGNIFEITRPLAAPGAMPVITFDVTLAAPPQTTIDTLTTAEVVADNAPMASTFYEVSIHDPE